MFRKEKQILKSFYTCILVVYCLPLYTFAADLTPEELHFRRQAVKRMIFDSSQDIPLASLNPSKIVGLDVMHPKVGENSGNSELKIRDGKLAISSEKYSVSTRWVGSFNPFAVYDITISNFTGTGQIGILFRDADSDSSISVTLVGNSSTFNSVNATITKNGTEVDVKKYLLEKTVACDKSVSLKIQMLAVGANIFIEQNQNTSLVGSFEFVNYFDLRNIDLMRRFESCLHGMLYAGASIEIDQMTAALSPGIGQADLRFVTYEDGSPYFKDDRLWVLSTLRGRGLPHPLQGVFSLNPSVFDIQFEGIILYDRADGLLRNDLASNIFFDRNDNQWKGFTTGFSAYGDPNKKEKKELWAVHSTKSPLQGMSVMRAKATGLVGDYEDPQCIFDSDAGKWRMVLCERHKGYKAVIRESDTWDGKYKLIAGPVPVNSTGTQIQRFGTENYVLFGSSDRKVYVYSYPELKPSGILDIYLPPWDKKSGTRIWPNVVPLPDGYPAPCMALTMDRLNYPGMKGANWTYGALYLYYGFPKQR